MKFIFFGSPEFASIILEKLIKAGFIPEAVVCNPDKPTGRKKIITPPATKIIAQKYNIPIWQPEKLNIQNIHNWRDRGNCIYEAPPTGVGGISPRIRCGAESRTEDHWHQHLSSNRVDGLLVRDQNLDLFIVAAYSQIIPKEILEIPRLGTIGIHPSLLPKYRGATPIQSVILNGNKKTGATLYLMDEKMDHGKIISNIDCSVSNNDNYETLMRKLAELSANLLIEILPDIENKLKNAKTQNESEAAYTKKIKTEDAFIKLEDLKEAEKNGGKIANEINRKIRAFYPEPGTYTFINDKRTKLLESEIIEDRLKLKKIQIEGKNPQMLK